MGAHGKLDTTPRKGAFNRIILPLLEKVLVPIVAAGIGAVGVYYAEIAKMARAAGREAAGEEIRRADDARKFVFNHLPAVAPVVTSTKTEPGKVDEASLKRMVDLWRARHPQPTHNIKMSVESDEVPQQDQDQNQDPWRGPPEDYIERAMVEVQQAQSQVQR